MRMLPHAQPPHLDAGHLAQIADATRHLRRARKADRVAGFSGVAILICGLALLPFSLGSGFGIALGLTLVVIGWRELSLRRDIRALEPLGFGRLARNQIALAIALSAYGVTRLLEPVPDTSGLSSAGLSSAGLGPMAGDLDQTVRRIAQISHYGVGAGIILLAWIVQGGQAMYYARAGKSLRRAHARCPVWVMRIHAAAWSGRIPGDPATEPLTRRRPLGPSGTPDPTPPEQVNAAA